ncbi:hypothetical protein [Mycobacteroides abscessus]|uniref:hypothetical protein n=1 Tax=Mycobacteroides abscessus TaxID=36809 RepID=UPI0010420B2D|nr:hypothetical protein [Mycobacteroides abscessus]
MSLPEPSAAGVVRLNPEAVRGHLKDVFAASDALSRLDIDSVLSAGSGACRGTDLVAGLSQHAVDEHAHVRTLSENANTLGEAGLGVIEAFRRADEL